MGGLFDERVRVGLQEEVEEGGRGAMDARSDQPKRDRISVHSRPPFKPSSRVLTDFGLPRIASSRGPPLRPLPRQTSEPSLANSSSKPSEDTSLDASEPLPGGRVESGSVSSAISSLKGSISEVEVSRRSSEGPVPSRMKVTGRVVSQCSGMKGVRGVGSSSVGVVGKGEELQGGKGGKEGKEGGGGELRLLLKQ